MHYANVNQFCRFAIVCGTLLAVGCTSDPADNDSCDELGLCLAEPEQGFQVRSEGTEIEAGTDAEYCEVIQLPGGPDDVFYVDGFEVAMTQFSHHLQVVAIEPGTETDANAQIGDRVPCSGTDVFGGELIPVTGSQLPYRSVTYPNGIGRKYTGGSKLIFDYHYFNTTAEPIRARAAVNFHTTDAAKVNRIMQIFRMVNIGISVPPTSTGAASAACSVKQEMDVVSLTRHTHRWGTDFSVWHSGGERDGEHIFTSTSYEEDVEHHFPEPLRLMPGEGFRFTCNFVNTEDYTLEFGFKATDEMCILYGDWYVPLDQDAQPLSNSCIVDQ